MTLVTADAAARLADVLRRRMPATVAASDVQRAAVAVVITREREGALLFVKRRERRGDPWSGHVAFPGGFRAADGEDASRTAERETEEETGLPLARLGERLGALDDVFPRSSTLPRVVVTPVVFAVAGRPEVCAGPEVELALWLPVARVFDPANHRPMTLQLPTGPMEFRSIVLDGLTIWGLTERVLGQIGLLLQSDRS